MRNPTHQVLLLTAGITDFTLRALIRSTSLTGLSSFAELMHGALGLRGAIALQLSVILNNFGLLIVYLILLGDVLAGENGSGVVPMITGVQNVYTSRPVLVGGVLVCVLFPLCCLRRMDSLKFTSTLAVALTMAFTTTVFILAMFALHKGRAHFPPLIPDALVNLSAGEAALQILATVPVILTGFICQYNVHPIYTELQPATERTMRQAMRISLFIVCNAYMISGIFAYVMFGNDTQGDVLANFTQETISDLTGSQGAATFIVIFVKSCYLFMLISVFPLLNYGLREALDAMVFPGAGPFTNARFYGITLTTALGSFVASMLIPSIFVAFQFIGATASALIGFIFPGVLVVCLYPQRAHKRKVQAWMIISLGVIMGVVGVTTTALNISKEDKPAPAPPSMMESFFYYPGM